MLDDSMKKILIDESKTIDHITKEIADHIGLTNVPVLSFFFFFLVTFYSKKNSICSTRSFRFEFQVRQLGSTLLSPSPSKQLVRMPLLSSVRSFSRPMRKWIAVIRCRCALLPHLPGPMYLVFYAASLFVCTMSRHGRLGSASDAGAGRCRLGGARRTSGISKLQPRGACRSLV